MEGHKFYQFPFLPRMHWQDLQQGTLHQFVEPAYWHEYDLIQPI